MCPSPASPLITYLPSYLPFHHHHHHHCAHARVWEIQRILCLTHNTASCCLQRESRGTMAAKELFGDSSTMRPKQVGNKSIGESFSTQFHSARALLLGEKRHFCCPTLDYCPSPQWGRCSYQRAHAGLNQWTKNSEMQLNIWCFVKINSFSWCRWASM